MLLTLATLNAVAEDAKPANNFVAGLGSAKEESTKTGLYIGIGSTGTAIDIGDDDAAVASLSLKLGYKINDNVAIEGRFIGESNDDDIGTREEIRLDSGQAIYLRLSLGNETFDPYILLGYSKLEGTQTLNRSYYYQISYYTYYEDYSYEYDLEESGGAFGFGANWKINETFSLTGDWTRPASDVVQFNLGLDFKF